MGAWVKKELVGALFSSVFGLLFSVTVEPRIENMIGAVDTEVAKQESTTTLQPVESEPPHPVRGEGDKPEPPEPDVPVETPPEFIEGVDTRGGLETTAIKIIGPNGERAYLEITILDAEHYWPIGRADVIMTPGGQEEDIFQFLDSSGLAKRIEKAVDLVAIGMASCELKRLNDETTEESRAQARAHQLINWIRRLEALPRETKLYTVNMGRFQDPDCSRKSPYQTRLQRNAILVSVVYKKNISSSRDLGRLIKAGLMDKDRLGLEIEKYSQPGFELRRHN